MSTVITFQKNTLRGFEINRDPSVVKIIPVSGGVDSSALAVLLHKSFPDVNFIMVNTDTGAEEKETYEMLDSIEQITGNKIDRIKGEADLFEYIELYKGYLPSVESRWCTRVLKLLPFQKWLKQFSGKPIQMFIGIRSDERSRLAFAIDECETVFPFIEADWNRDDVFSYVSRTIGVPKPYETRTRSGCTVCPFVSRQELIGLLERRPDEFAKGMSYEKLAEGDASRHSEAPALWADSGIARNWQSLPVPKDDAKLSGKARKGGGLFGLNGIFVGVEYFYDGFPGLPQFIFHQRIVSYSTSMAGIKKQLSTRFQHLLRASEVYEMSPNEVRSNARFAIWYVELDGSVFDTAGPAKDSYTWQKAQSYAQIRHITQWAERCLHAHFMRQSANTQVKSEISWLAEWRDSAKSGIAKVDAGGVETGAVVSGMWFQPTEVEIELTAEEEVTQTPCPMCHI